MVPDGASCAGRLSQMRDGPTAATARTLTPEERKKAAERVQKKQRSCRFTVDELARLARQYRYPYNSYGRLKSCLGLTGQLPRSEYRRDCEVGH